MVGPDDLYADTTHPHLRRIVEANLAPGGRVPLADPYWADGLPLREWAGGRQVAGDSLPVYRRGGS